jgi:A/G-specific adenine glycosylase
VWTHYKKSGRHELPWRKTHNPYKILVSEVMLQQTQVERVIPYYKAFLKKFPTVRALARADLSAVLKLWQGLGYNRRAKMLREAAKQLVHTPLPGTRSNLVAELEELPGVGPYTARAVAGFAYNQDVVFVETNIRTAVTHHFFAGKKKVSDADVLKVLEGILPKGRSREWYSALMDYGAFLKRSGVQLNAKSKHYTKQSKFAGSAREARGAILRALAKEKYQGLTLLKLVNILGPSRRAQARGALTALLTEGLIEKRGRRFRLPR